MVTDTRDIDLQDTWDDKDIKNLSCKQLEKVVKDGWDVNTSHLRDGRTLLFDAVRLGRVDLVHTLIKLGADVNKSDENGDTPLHIAAGIVRSPIIRQLSPHILRKDLIILKQLLKAGADIYARNNCKEMPINIASEFGNNEAANILIDADSISAHLNRALTQFLQEEELLQETGIHTSQGAINDHSAASEAIAVREQHGQQLR